MGLSLSRSRCCSSLLQCRAILIPFLLLLVLIAATGTVHALVVRALIEVGADVVAELQRRER